VKQQYDILYSLMIYLFHIGTMIKEKDYTDHPINLTRRIILIIQLILLPFIRIIFHDDTSVLMSSYIFTNLFIEELLCMEIEMVLHVIS
jgi:hypothetical protein